jgi:hypothetical protein
MARVRALAVTLSQNTASDCARAAIVAGCAVALILAGAPLPA